MARSPHAGKTLVPGTPSEAVSQVRAITELPTTLSDKVEKTNVSPIKVDLKKVKIADQTTTETNFQITAGVNNLLRITTLLIGRFSRVLLLKLLIWTSSGKSVETSGNALKLVKLSNLEGIRLKRTKTAPQNCGNYRLLYGGGGKFVPPT